MSSRAYDTRVVSAPHRGVLVSHNAILNDEIHLNWRQLVGRVENTDSLASRFHLLERGESVVTLKTHYERFDISVNVKERCIEVKATRITHASFLKECYFRFKHCHRLRSLFGKTSLQDRANQIQQYAEKALQCATLEITQTKTQ